MRISSRESVFEEGEEEREGRRKEGKRGGDALFSRIDPSGIWIRLPSLATMMTVPRRVTFFPKTTSPLIVTWSASRMCGIVLNRFWKSATFLNVSPSLTTGVVAKSREGFMTSAPS